MNDTVSVAPRQSITTYSYTLRGLYSGMSYTIIVRAGNVLGGSDLILTNGATIPIAGIVYSRMSFINLSLSFLYSSQWLAYFTSSFIS